MKKVAWLLFASGVAAIALAVLQYGGGRVVYVETLLQVRENYQLLVERGIAQAHPDAFAALNDGIEQIQFQYTMQTAICFLFLGLLQTVAAILILRWHRTTPQNLAAQRAVP